jgi:hypothetical protein
MEHPKCAKNLDSPHPLTPSPKHERRGTRIMSPLLGRGAGGEGKNLSLHWDTPNKKRLGNKFAQPLFCGVWLIQK